MLKTKHKQKVLLQVIKLKGKVLTTMFSSREWKKPHVQEQFQLKKLE